MNHVSDSLREVLARSGMHDRTVAAGKVVLNEGRGAASDGALSQVKASNLEGGLGYSPIGRQGGGWQPMGMKDAEAVAPARNRSRQRTGDPSPAQGRPVLRLLQGGSSKPSRAGKAQLRLVLT